MKHKNPYRYWLQDVAAILFGLAIVVLVGLYIYCDFMAFKGKFPNAAWWVWLFGH
jgi:hypothetical protein